MLDRQAHQNHPPWGSRLEGQRPQGEELGHHRGPSTHGTRLVPGPGGTENSCFINSDTCSRPAGSAGSSVWLGGHPPSWGSPDSTPAAATGLPTPGRTSRAPRGAGEPYLPLQVGLEGLGLIQQSDAALPSARQDMGGRASGEAGSPPHPPRPAAPDVRAPCPRPAVPDVCGGQGLQLSRQKQLPMPQLVLELLGQVHHLRVLHLLLYFS